MKSIMNSSRGLPSFVSQKFFALLTKANSVSYAISAVVFELKSPERESEKDSRKRYTCQRSCRPRLLSSVPMSRLAAAAKKIECTLQRTKTHTYAHTSHCHTDANAVPLPNSCICKTCEVTLRSRCISSTCYLSSSYLSN